MYNVHKLTLSCEIRSSNQEGLLCMVHAFCAVLSVLSSFAIISLGKRKNRWRKFYQIWCVSYSHEWGVQRQFFVAPHPGALGRGQKVKYHLISITKSISMIFILNFVFVLTNERYNTY